MSPYIFILCMERLSRDIDGKVNSGTWDLLKISSQAPSISHRFFADDLTLFAIVNAKNYNTTKATLQLFHSQDGQKVNYTKSRVFFSKNCPTTTKATYVGILGIHEHSSFDKYLVFPMFHKNPSNGDFQYILDNLRKKLARWKNTTLTMAGRVVLANSASKAFPPTP